MTSVAFVKTTTKQQQDNNKTTIKAPTKAVYTTAFAP